MLFSFFYFDFFGVASDYYASQRREQSSRLEPRVSINYAREIYIYRTLFVVLCLSLFD